MKRKAFTLAEVLITLGIIGIVAAMTMPSLVANHKEKEMITAWKKAYSDISNAALLMSQNAEDLSTEQLIGETFAKYIKIDKVCEADKDVVQGCWPANTPIYSYDKRLKLANNIGSLGAGSVCMNTVSGGALCIDTGGRYTILYFDVNGARKPNIVGRDLFAAILDKETYIVRVAQGHRQSWGAADGHFVGLTEGDGTCTGDSRGWGCSAFYILK